MTDVPEHLSAALAGRYTIERELGAGGMATVYLARDLKHDRDVALKVLRPELAAVLGADRFLAEIRITARLDHPHILTLIDSGEAGGLLYYVLPYVHGESLRVKLQREKQLGLDEALRIVRQIAGALDHAHRQGVIHRDIKPENILLFEGEAMLTDFGIALAVREAGGNRLTESGLSLGTPQYMSPEQATGDRTLDARSDVYSLGAVLYEMLAGEPPVTGPTVQAVIAKLLTERPIRLRSVRDTVPEGLDAAVAKALAKVPADRFASAANFVAALTAAGAAPAEKPRRSRWLVPAAAVVVVIAAAAAIWAVVRGPSRAVPGEFERVQLTFTGNAEYPAISEDGRRVAYATRRCDADGRCIEDIVVQDVGGAGAATVVRGAGSLWDMNWTADGRYLVFNASFAGGRWGGFSVPSLGGEPLHLGCCYASLVPGTDTALVSGPPSTDSLAWLRWVTIADGMVRDSVLLTGTYGDMAAEAFPGGRRLYLSQGRWRGLTLFVADRAGHRIDSLRVENPDPSGESDLHTTLSPDGSAILVLVPRERAPEERDILAYRVDGDGRIARRPDTLARQLPITGGVTVARNGTLVYASGPVGRSLWALRRESPATMRFTQRRLSSATGGLGGLVSPAGDRVLVVRGAIVGERALAQLSVMPFDSGPERALGPPQDLAGLRWTPDGTAVLAAVTRGSDSVALLRLDPASARSEPVGTFAASDFGRLVPLPQGGFLLLSRTTRELRRVGVPGLSDTTYHPPDGMYHFLHLDPSPDGRELVSAAWTVGWDSIIVHRLSLADGRATRLAGFYGEAVYGARWLTDGSLIVQILETAWTLAWYGLPAIGGPPVRLGTAPRFPAGYDLSADGRRVIALVFDVRSDVYLIRDFGKVLRR